MVEAVVKGIIAGATDAEMALISVVNNGNIQSLFFPRHLNS